MQKKQPGTCLVSIKFISIIDTKKKHNFSDLLKDEDGWYHEAPNDRIIHCFYGSMPNAYAFIVRH